MKKIKKEKLKITKEIYTTIRLMIKSSNPEDMFMALETWKNMEPSNLLTLLLIKSLYLSERDDVKKELVSEFEPEESWDEILERIDWNNITNLERELLTKEFEKIILNKPFIRDIQEYIYPIKIKLKK